MDEGKTFLRRYDQKREYMIREGEFPICRRSYLGEKMPVAEFPQSAVFRGIEKQGVEGALSEHWVQDDGFSRVHFYLTMDDCTPRLLVEEIQVEPGSYTPLMTYEFLSFRSYPPQVRLQNPFFPCCTPTTLICSLCSQKKFFSYLSRTLMRIVKGMLGDFHTSIYFTIIFATEIKVAHVSKSKKKNGVLAIIHQQKSILFLHSP
jgi:hypothetical protein